jgi:hypothetical protein
MSDDTNKRGKEDRSRINTNQISRGVSAYFLIVPYEWWRSRCSARIASVS